MTENLDLNTVQFLAWVAGGRRTYEEAMEAWRSTCPRLSAWEDALGDGLISLENAGAGPAGQCKVVLTPRGRAALNENNPRGRAAPDRNTQGND
jgi:hypothetical protein